ncbi:MAG: hypothetical protein MZW92_77610 [Comamonadaceae bacterium]|nr:hypothetical protein [Comamonadaceae bacterium]
MTTQYLRGSAARVLQRQLPLRARGGRASATRCSSSRSRSTASTSTAST